ncbi:MAG: hypothetical protein ACLUOI_34705 [Eisenbergiella sp.]
MDDNQTKQVILNLLASAFSNEVPDTPKHRLKQVFEECRGNGYSAYWKQVSALSGIGKSIRSLEAGGSGAAVNNLHVIWDMRR